jgi:Tfp pilus assembly protein PilF
MGELTEKLQKARHDPDIRSAIGRIFLRSGEEREGLAWLKTVLRLHPRHAPTHQALADYYEKRRQLALAEHHRSLAATKSETAPR